MGDSEGAVNVLCTRVHVCEGVVVLHVMIIKGVEECDRSFSFGVGEVGWPEEFSKSMEDA